MDIDTNNPEVRRGLLGQYQQFRKVGRQLNNRLVETLDKQTIEEAGRRLGIFRKGKLYFDTEDVAAVLMDYAIHHLYQDGRSAVDRYLEDSPPPADSEEMGLQRALREVRYSLFQIREVVPGFGLWVEDILRAETGLLIDVSFSETVSRHQVLAGNIYAPAGFWMTTGASLPVSAEALARLAPSIKQTFGAKPEDFRGLGREQQADLATLVVRTCLQSGMAEHISYTPSEPGRTAPSPRPRWARSTGGLGQSSSQSGPTRAGRNDPCPCGSGRKYKNCCLRR